MSDLRLKYKSEISSWLLFLLNPFIAAIIALINHRKSFAKNIVWLFVAYYGFTLVISDSGMDANRYRDFFLRLRYMDLSFASIGDLIYQEGSGFIDVAQLVISLFVSRFTDDPRILFAVFGLVFGYFYSRNIWLLLERTKGGIKGSSLLYIFVFAITIGFWQVSGFRMWTAAHVFFYGAFLFLMDNKKSGILIASSSILFHFSFLFPVTLLLVFIALPKKVTWFYWIFIITFFISEIDIQQVSDSLNRILPVVFRRRIEGYTSEAYVQAIIGDVATRNWRYSFYQSSIKWAATGFLTMIYLFGRHYINENRRYAILLCFALLLMASVNLLSHIPSMSRFYSVSYLFVFAFIFLYLQNAPDFRFKKPILLAAFPLLIFYCLGMINISFMTIGFVTLVGNPIVALMPSSSEFNYAIIELFR